MNSRNALLNVCLTESCSNIFSLFHCKPQRIRAVLWATITTGNHHMVPLWCQKPGTVFTLHQCPAVLLTDQGMILFQAQIRSPSAASWGSPASILTSLRVQQACFSRGRPNNLSWVQYHQGGQEWTQGLSTANLDLSSNPDFLERGSLA